jgi:hypothetical protein
VLEAMEIQKHARITNLDCGLKLDPDSFFVLVTPPATCNFNILPMTSFPDLFISNPVLAVHFVHKRPRSAQI